MKVYIKKKNRLRVKEKALTQNLATRNRSLSKSANAKEMLFSVLLHHDLNV